MPCATAQFTDAVPTPLVRVTVNVNAVVPCGVAVELPSVRFAPDATTLTTGQSSLTTVTAALATPIVPTEGADSATLKVSASSTAVSPTSWMVIVRLVSSMAKLAVPEVVPVTSDALVVPWTSA